MNLLRLITVLALLASIPFVASAGPIVFERALPTSNVNNDAPGNPAVDANRSNFKWTAPNYISGDDFMLSADDVIALSVWMIAENPGTTNPNQEIASLKLFGGQDSLGVGPTTLGLLSSTYSFSAVGGQGFWNPVRSIFQPIFKITFTNMSWVVQGGVLYDFAVEGLSLSGNMLSLSASTAGLSGGTQDGADGGFLGFTPSAGGYDLTYGVTSATTGFDGDINVEIQTVPEPATMSLFVIGGAFAFFLRRKK